MLMALLAILDMAAGVSMLVPNFLGFYIGIAMLIKGGSSLLGLAGDIQIVVIGIIDIAAGIMLVTGFFVPFFWVVLALKGLYSLIAGLG